MVSILTRDHHEDNVLDLIADLQRRVKDLEAYAATGLFEQDVMQTPGSVDAEGNVTLSGDLSVGGDAEISGDLDVLTDLGVTGDADVSSDVKVAGGLAVGSLSVDPDTGAIHLVERSSDPGEPAEGEVIMWLSDGTGKGEDGDVLVAAKAGGATKVATLLNHTGEAVRVYNAGGHTIGDATWTTLTWDSEEFDTNDLHSTSSDTDRLTAQVDGLYVMFFHGTFAVDEHGQRICDIRLNDTNTIAIGGITLCSASYAQRVWCSTVYELEAGEYVNVRVYQNGGGDLALTNSRFSMVLIHADAGQAW